MQSAPLPTNELERLAILHGYRVLDTAPERGFDDLTAIAATLCQTPIALVSLIDTDRQWFKSRHGLGATETPRSLAFCAHAILQHGVFVVPDATLDARFFDNPLTVGVPHVRFYAGAPLVAPSGHHLGTLCVIDRMPRTLSTEQQEALTRLARLTISQLELRHKCEATGSQASVSHALSAPPVVIPIATSAEPARRETSMANKPQAELPDLSGRTVLVVEDSDTNLMLIEMLLKKCNAVVITASTGSAALALCQQRPFDLVLMDGMMPEMDGYQATTAIRALPHAWAKEVPIIALTANASEGDREHCLRVGMSDYVAKPIVRTQLWAALHRALTPSRRISTQPLAV